MALNVAMLIIARAIAAGAARLAFIYIAASGKALPCSDLWQPSTDHIFSIFFKRVLLIQMFPVSAFRGHLAYTYFIR